jgi:hypothetical protein
VEQGQNREIGQGQDFHPETKYRVCCARYWPMIEIEGGGHGGSTYGEVHRVNAAAEGRG